MVTKAATVATSAATMKVTSPLAANRHRAAKTRHTSSSFYNRQMKLMIISCNGYFCGVGNGKTVNNENMGTKLNKGG